MVLPGRFYRPVHRMEVIMVSENGKAQILVLLCLIAMLLLAFWLGTVFASEYCTVQPVQIVENKSCCCNIITYNYTVNHYNSSGEVPENINIGPPSKFIPLSSDGDTIIKSGPGTPDETTIPGTTPEEVPEFPTKSLYEKMHESFQPLQPLNFFENILN